MKMTLDDLLATLSSQCDHVLKFDHHRGRLHQTETEEHLHISWTIHMVRNIIIQINVRSNKIIEKCHL
jgi:hypothetical protein